MKDVYYWLGFVVFWGLAAAALVVAWRLRPHNAFTRFLRDAWEWLAVYVFGKRYHFPLEGAELIISASKAFKWAGWRRNLAAFMIRDSKRKGWKEPY